MKTIQLLKTAGSIACVAFALNATAQSSGSAPSAASETIGQHVDDGTITTKAKAELLSAKNVKSTHIHVKTRKGVVWLTGSVPSALLGGGAEKRRSVALAVRETHRHLGGRCCGLKESGPRITTEALWFRPLAYMSRQDRAAGAQRLCFWPLTT